MASVITIDETGAHAMSLAEIVAELQERYKAAFGEDLSLSPQTPQAQILGITAAITAEVTEAIVEDVNANSVDHAGGVLLRQLGSLLGIEPLRATHSRVTATLAGVSGTGVRAGSRARTEDGDEFETLADAILSPDGVSVDMQAVDPGAVEAPAGSLTEIVTVINGWETITNPAAASVGVDGETDRDYRLTYQARTGRLAEGAQSALEAAVEEAGGLRQRIVENPTSAATVEQSFPLFPHSVAVVTEAGAAGDLTRAVELRRGQGVTTMAAIRGAAPTNANLASVNAGRITWAGTEYTGLDISSDTTGAARAATLTTLLASSARAVDVRFIDGRYMAFYGWAEGDQPTFANGSSGTLAADFGLLAADATAALGPFFRARERALTVSAAVTRRTGFPADGFAQLRDAVQGVVSGYGIGDEVWSNDILSALERVPGTRVTTLTVQYASAAISGVAVPLDVIWTLAASDLEITIT